MLVRYRGKIIKVSWRDPGQNGRFLWPFLVLWNVSLPENVEKWTFRCHVRPNRLKICMYDRMLGAVTLETSKPPQFQPELRKNHFLWKKRFFQFVFCQRWTSITKQTGKTKRNKTDWCKSLALGPFSAARPVGFECPPRPSPGDGERQHVGNRKKLKIIFFHKNCLFQHF